jgi:three-Cys-motif partner protein
MHVSDAHPALAEAARVRLAAAGAPVMPDVGKAAETVDRIISRLNKWALHFAFVDPYSLGLLEFEIIRKLATLNRMDILIHVSVQDMNRNLRKYIKKQGSALDVFAPDWRNEVDTGRPDYHVRARIFEHWRDLLKTVGMTTAEAAELVTGEKHQPLYWLAFAARHPRALQYWEKIRRLDQHQQAEVRG